MNYKKVFKSQKARFFTLGLLKPVPSRWMISIQYFLKLKRFPKIRNAERYTEKLQSYKLYYRNSLMTVCADKYAVRDYVASKGLSEILNELYMVSDNINSVDFYSLPNEYVLKTTNGCGSNYFLTDPNDFEIKEVKKEVVWWMKKNLFTFGREWSYKNIKPRIIIEKLLYDDNNRFHGINDYKFLCFDGNPQFVVLDVDRAVAHKRNIYNMNWELINVSTDYPNIGQDIPMPINFQRMIDIAKILSDGFPHVRVDLYNVSGKIYFGEMTFYPWTGYIQFYPDSFDFQLGSYFRFNK